MGSREGRRGIAAGTQIYMLKDLSKDAKVRFSHKFKYNPAARKIK
jgi:hypothetical protein